MSSETGSIDRWLDQTSDRLNPLLVRETRQWVKSPSFMVSFLTLVGLCWFAAAFEIAVPRAFTGLFFDGPPGMLRPDGRSLFALYFVALTASVFLTVPMTAFFSFTREYAEDAIDILRATPLSSGQVAWGKLQTALLQMLLYFSAIAPFVCLTYLLQGVGLVAIIFSLILIAVGGTFLAAVGLALGSFSRSPGWQVVNLLLLLGAIGFSGMFFLTIGLATHRTASPEAVVAGTSCSVLICSFVGFFGMLFAISNVRPQDLRLRLPFIDPSKLKSIISTSREFAALLRDEFPVHGIERDWTLERSAAFPEIYERSMKLAYSLERTINRFPAYADRHQYVTFDAADKPLRHLLQAFDRLILELNWSDMTSGLLFPRTCWMRQDGTPPLRALTLRHIEDLETSAAAIEAACLTIAEPHVSSAGR